jgi:hypothetical protein
MVPSLCCRITAREFIQNSNDCRISKIALCESNVYAASVCFVLSLFLMPETRKIWEPQAINA